PYYWTSECVAEDGSVAAILDGENATVNRVESTTRTLSWTPGFSRAQSQAELMRLAYQFLFQYHQDWSPNLKVAEGWKSLASDECIVQGPYDSEYLDAPPSRPTVCRGEPLVGFDEDRGAQHPMRAAPSFGHLRTPGSR